MQRITITLDDELMEELDAIIVDLTIGETFFFRHRELFDALRTTVLPALIARNQHDAGLVSVKFDPLLRKIRGDPRYSALLERMNLPR